MLWFQFYRASNFYCMAIAADSSSLTGPPSAADWVAVGVAAELETSITAATVVASTAVAICHASSNDTDVIYDRYSLLHNQSRRSGKDALCPYLHAIRNSPPEESRGCQD